MNKILLIALHFLFATQLFAQTEFKTYNNGLIYSETTMGKLEHIVDSLNLKYKVCDFNKVFYAQLQTVGYIVQIDYNKIKLVKKDMEENMSFENFVKKYPAAKVEKGVLVVRNIFKEFDGSEYVLFREIKLNGNEGFEIFRKYEPDLYNKSLKNSWLFDYVGQSKFSKGSIQAFYFPEDFKSIPLNQKYCRQIGYADCLIDTSSGKLKDNLNEGWVGLPQNWQSLSQKEKENLLDQMRSVNVVGQCSMDSRPREHAMNIALLSAETTNWHIFLKSHLDIMNDRFERVTDGSYAFLGRKTYIKELEDLDINVPDLIIGVSLWIENPAKHHYFGNISRLGRAIAESKNKAEFKKQILSMVADKELDYFNRMLSYFLFLNYNNFIENKTEQNANLKLLDDAVSTLPEFLRNKIVLDQQ